MRKPFWLPGLLLILAATAHAQNPQMNQRRAMLQGQIVERFMDRVSEQLQLEPAARGRLQQHLRESGERRRVLGQRSAQLRRQIMEAVRDPKTQDSEFRRLLNDMTGLRQQEEDFWKSDQEALSHILTPRQQAQFVFMWLRFTDQIREMTRPAGPAFGRPRP